MHSSRSKIKLGTKEALKVSDLTSYELILETMYGCEPKIIQRFSRKTVYEIFHEAIFSKKFSKQNFSNKEVEVLIKYFIDKPPESIRIMAPISGIRLDGEEKLIIGSFEIGKSTNLPTRLSNNDDYYICIEIKESYDNIKSISVAQEEFEDFIRLIYFIAGKKDNSVFIKTGLPSYPSYNHHQMYVETSSYQIQTSKSIFGATSVSNTIAEKIPVDDAFFIKNEKFDAIWGFYKNRKSDHKNSDFHSRILNCTLALGEAIRSKSQKDSIIHTCIALEILLSYDEGSLFQKSIGDRLAETFVFIVAKDKEARFKISTLLKKVYRMRSALVHGGDKEIDQSYVDIIQLTRAAIGELLTSEKYKKVIKISALYELVKDAHNSY